MAKLEQISKNYTNNLNGQQLKMEQNSDDTVSVSVNVSNIKEISLENQDNTSRKMYPIQPVKLLEFETPDGTGNCTHPSVLRFRTSWNGYKFWMAMTPYANTTQENPCIYGSNDGINWIIPNGITNPLYPAPENTPTNYNSDTELIFDKSSNKLVLYYREFKTTGVTIYRSESSNGVNWSERVKCIFDDNKDPIAPSIFKTDKYYMFIGYTFGFYESTDGINWSNFKECKTNIDLTGYVWHGDVKVTGSKFRMVAAVVTKGKNVANETELYYAESTDMINWTFDSVPLLARNPDLPLYDERVYKSCAVYYGQDVLLYSSGLTSGLGERIGYTKVRLK